MPVKRVDCFFLEVEDRPGVIAQFARQLKDAKVMTSGKAGGLAFAGPSKGPFRKRQR